jgi:hypothetical protein
METVIKAERSTLGLLRLVGPCGCSIEVVPRLAAEQEPVTMATWDALVKHVTQRTPCGEMRAPLIKYGPTSVLNIDGHAVCTWENEGGALIASCGWPARKVGEVR